VTVPVRPDVEALAETVRRGMMPLRHDTYKAGALEAHRALSSLLAVLQQANADEKRTRDTLRRMTRSAIANRNGRWAAEAGRDVAVQALRYIAGFDVAGYEGHLRSEDVARDALAALEAAGVSGSDDAS